MLLGVWLTGAAISVSVAAQVGVLALDLQRGLCKVERGILRPYSYRGGRHEDERLVPTAIAKRLGIGRAGVYRLHGKKQVV